MVENNKSIQVSVSLPNALFKHIEKNREESSRSDYIRQVLEESKEYNIEKKSNGIVYTPQNLAEYVSNKVLSYYFSIQRNIELLDNGKGYLNIIDPACGDGELLLSISNSNSFAKNFSKRLQLNLYGIDIDKKALNKANKRLSKFNKFIAINTNGLCPYQYKNKEGWEKIKAKLENESGFDIAIANPPWGADISDYSELLEDSNLALFKGQYDTSDLFIESALKNVRNGGFIAFIIPDSLFYQERGSLREYLLNNSKIHFIARFGEKIFKGINRACAVIICEKTKVSLNHKVDCFRLTVEQRNLILYGKTSFEEAEKKLSHMVNQFRFASNKNYLFNIDINSDLESTYNKILTQNNTLYDYLNGSRGVELSKKGNVIQCTECHRWLPCPNKVIVDCMHCKSSIIVSECNKEVIIHKQDKIYCKPLIVGEHVNRYSIRSDLWIDCTKKGINYKASTLYTDKKLVVRKTGIGVSASIDYSGRFTNQVVYIFKLKPTVKKNIPLELFLAFLNSRLAFFLISMSNGEIEWRSHPYITQKQVLDLPVPNLDSLNTSNIKRINSLTNKLKNCLQKDQVISNGLDAKLERLIADLYGLTNKNYESIYQAIEKSQELLTVKALKNIKVQDIFSPEAI